MKDASDSEVLKILERFPTVDEIRGALSRNIREAAFLRRALKVAKAADAARDDNREVACR